MDSIYGFLFNTVEVAYKLVVASRCILGYDAV